jgi:hypothetical protein
MTRQGLNADFAPVADALGRVEGITGYLKTNQHISKAVRSLATAAANDVGDMIDEQTRAMGYAHSPLSHVYEYQAFRTGDMKNNRLFRFNVNTGGSRNAVVSFMFKDSRFPIATPRENVEAGLISLRQESIDAFEAAGDKRYVFRTQAASFEYGADVTVRSQDGADGWLAVPQKFNPRPRFFQGSYERDLSHEYDGIHFGAFTDTWIKLNSTVNKDNLERVDKGIQRIMKQNTARSGRVSKKGFSIAFRAAEKQGMNFAQRETDRMYSSVVQDKGGLL